MKRKRACRRELTTGISEEATTENRKESRRVVHVATENSDESRREVTAENSGECRREATTENSEEESS